MSSTLSTLSPSQRLAIASAGILVAASAAMDAAGAPDVGRFVVSALALAALAALVGESIEEIGEHMGPGPTGLLQSSIGNLPELLVGVFALRAGLTSVVRAALVGSVLGNVLLVLGVAFLSGGARHGAQKFDPEGPRMLVTLLTLAVAAMLVPTLAAKLDTPAVHHTAALSDAAAIVLLAVYLISIPFWLSGGPATGAQTLGPTPIRGRSSGPGATSPSSVGLQVRGWARALGRRRAGLWGWPFPCSSRPASRPAPYPTGSWRPSRRQRGRSASPPSSRGS